MEQIVLNNGKIVYVYDDYDSVGLVREYLGDGVANCLDELLDEAYGISEYMAEEFDDAMREIKSCLEYLGIDKDPSIEAIVKNVEKEIKNNREYVKALIS